MAITKNELPKNINIEFKYSCAMELVCSLHVISDPSHHTNCANWYDNMLANINKKLLKKIIDFGDRYVDWSFVMDLVDVYSRPPANPTSFFDDFNTVMDCINDLPKEEFAYIFLGETLLGDRDNIYYFTVNPNIIDDYDLNELYQYISKETVSAFLNDIDSVKSDMIAIMNDYYQDFFKENWKQTWEFYRGAYLKEKKNFSISVPVNFIMSLHDGLSMDKDNIIINKQTHFVVKTSEIKIMTIVLSAYTYPHLMINIYGDDLKDNKTNRISIYRNMLIPNMTSPFEQMAQSVKVLSDPTRIAIVKMLIDGGLTNKSISSLLSISPASVSQHLKILKDADLLSAVREKNNILYSIDKDKLSSDLKAISDFLSI